MFTFDGSIPLATLASLYSLPIPEDLQLLTIAEAFAERFEERVEVGDRIQCGPANLIVLTIDGEGVAQAVLEIDDSDVPENPVRALTGSITRIFQPCHRTGRPPAA